MALDVSIAPPVTRAAPPAHPLRFVGLVWLVQRLILSGLGALVVAGLPDNAARADALAGSSLTPADGPLYALLDPWWRWDAQWYLEIARYGYAAVPGSTAFPPLYPALVALVGRLLFGSYALAGLVVSNVAYVGALLFLYRLTLHLFDARTARRAVILFAAFPSAFFCLGIYSESLFLCLTLAVFFYAERGRWWVAMPLAALATLTRTQGFLIALPLLYLCATPRRSSTVGVRGGGGCG